MQCNKVGNDGHATHISIQQVCFKTIDEDVDDIVEEEAETIPDDAVIEEEIEWAATGPSVDDFAGVQGE